MRSASNMMLVPMGRTESTTYTVPPNDEHDAIRTMECFGWKVLGVQEIRLENTRLESRAASMFSSANELWSVTTTTHYMRLTFSRDLDEPNLAKLRELERRYLALGYPPKPFSFVSAHWVGGVALSFCLVGIPIIAMIILQFAWISPAIAKWKASCVSIEQQRNAVLAEAKQY